MTESKLAHSATELQHAREALLDDYDPEALHRLRVNVRRIRGHLAHVDGKPARQLRRDLKRLVSQTNEARDWDTLRDRLAGPDNEPFAALLPAVAVFQSRAHAKVEAMLRTPAWAESLEAWRSLSQRQPEPASPGASTVHGAAVRFLRAREIAMEGGSTDDWHKLRIATKNLRYCLDELAAAGGVDDRVGSGVALCEQLQDDLGAWHDTVVHRELIRALPGDELQDGAADARSALEHGLLEEGQSCLQRAEARMRQHRDLLFSLAALD